jgi:hypothetical protein
MLTEERVGYRLLDYRVSARCCRGGSLCHCAIVFYSIRLTSCFSICGDPDSVGTTTAAGQVRGYTSLRVVVEGLVNMARMVSSTGNCCHRRSDSKISNLHLVVS